MHLTVSSHAEPARTGRAAMSEQTVTLVRSLKDSLAHRSTNTLASAFT